MDSSMEDWAFRVESEWEHVGEFVGVGQNTEDEDTVVVFITSFDNQTWFCFDDSTGQFFVLTNAEIEGPMPDEIP